MSSPEGAITDMGHPRPHQAKGSQPGSGVTQGGRLGCMQRGQGLLGLENPDHRVADAWEISSELAKCTSKSCPQLPAIPQLSGRSPRASPNTYQLAVWCPKGRPLQCQPWGPGGGVGSLGYCWSSARHLGCRWDQGPAGLGAEVTLGWAAGGLATLQGWSSEVSGLHALWGAPLPPAQGHLLALRQNPTRGAYIGPRSALGTGSARQCRHGQSGGMCWEEVRQL